MKASFRVLQISGFYGLVSRILRTTVAQRNDGVCLTRLERWYTGLDLKICLNFEAYNLQLNGHTHDANVGAHIVYGSIMLEERNY